MFVMVGDDADRSLETNRTLKNIHGIRHREGTVQHLVIQMQPAANGRIVGDHRQTRINRIPNDMPVDERLESTGNIRIQHRIVGPGRDKRRAYLPTETQETATAETATLHMRTRNRETDIRTVVHYRLEPRGGRTLDGNAKRPDTCLAQHDATRWSTRLKRDNSTHIPTRIHDSVRSGHTTHRNRNLPHRAGNLIRKRALRKPQPGDNQPRRHHRPRRHHPPRIKQIRRIAKRTADTAKCSEITHKGFGTNPVPKQERPLQIILREPRASEPRA